MHKYFEQYRRLIRAYVACEAAYTIVDSQPGISRTSSISEQEKQKDNFLWFFSCCYHLKDWIINDTSVSKSIQERVEPYINDSRPLALSGDITNANKHLIRTRKARASKDTTLDIIPLIMGPLGTSPIGGIYRYILNINTGVKGEGYEVISLAKECIDEWDKFFRENNLPLPRC